MTFGEKVKTLRKQKNITQTALANMAHLSQPTIVRYEQEKVVPTHNNAYQVAMALGVDVDMLLDDERSVV